MADDETPDIDVVDQIGRAAGAELRRPAPDAGVQRIAVAARRRRTTRNAVVGGLAVAALIGAGAVIGLARRSDDVIRTSPSDPSAPSTAATITSTEAPETTAPSTAAPSTAVPTSLVPATGVASTTGAPPSTAPPTDPAAAARVSHLDPPPELGLRQLASISVAERTAGYYTAAIGDLGVAVSSWHYDGQGPVRIDIVGFDGQVRSFDGLDRTDVESSAIIAYGPGDVVYATRQGSSIDDFAVVAIALSGSNAGDIVASTPQNINRFLEYPAGTFGHSEAGVADRRPGGVDLTPPIPYVDAEGEATVLGPSPAWFTLHGTQSDDLSDGGIVRSSTGVSWSLAVEAAPDRASPFVENSPPAAGPNGVGVYWTHIGPDAAPEQDFGEPTMWVIAEMRPDGSATWWSIPDGWHVIASDIWGTVLARHVGTELHLALAELGGPSVATNPIRADLERALSVLDT